MKISAGMENIESKKHLCNRFCLMFGFTASAIQITRKKMSRTNILMLNSSINLQQYFVSTNVRVIKTHLELYFWENLV